MHSFLQLPTHFSLVHILGVVGLVLAAGVAGFLLLRKKQSDAEKEYDRRMSLNVAGRMTDGSLTEAPNFDEEPSEMYLVFYRYSVAGVTYTAAQDVTQLRNQVAQISCLPGESVTVKYDHQNPSNSIVVCEIWSGLRRNGGSRKAAHSQDKVLAAS